MYSHHLSHTTEPGKPARPFPTGHRNPQLRSIPVFPTALTELLAFHAPPNSPSLPHTTDPVHETAGTLLADVERPRLKPEERLAYPTLPKMTTASW